MTEPTPHTLSPNSAPEADRIPPKGETPRISDTLVNVTGAPDADYHPEALANAVADSEAGAMPDNDEGGIVPLKRRD